MRAFLAIGGLFFWHEKILHALLFIVPQKGGVVEPAIFADILCISAAFFSIEGVVVLFEGKRIYGKRCLVEVCCPFVDLLRVWREVVQLFLADEGSKEGVFIDNDCAAAAKALDEG